MAVQYRRLWEKSGIEVERQGRSGGSCFSHWDERRGFGGGRKVERVVCGK